MSTGNPAFTSPSQGETLTTPEVKSFSTNFIAERIRAPLESQEVIKEVKSLDVKGNGNEIALTIEVSAQKGVTVNIGVQAVLENKADTIGVKSYKIDAGWMIKRTVEGIIVPKLNQVSQILKSYIENEEKRGVEKIKIKDGELKVEFKK
jgi:hypothetical protein